jgi:uncharacterized Zn finger protein
MASVADLVEPLVALPDSLPAEVRGGAARLHDANAVRLRDFGPLRVTADVTDDVVHRVELASTDVGLSASCDCPLGSGGRLCPHSLATALETWERAPRRRQ